MAGKPWTDEQKAAARAKREAAGTAAPKRPASRAKGKDPVAEAVETIAGVITVPLMALGNLNEAFLADGLALEMTAPALGTAVAEVAKVNPALGDWLGKSAPMTPYLLLGSVLFSLGTQIAVNHGVNVGPLAGSVNPRAAMIVEARGRIAAVQQAAAADDAAYQQMKRDEEADRQEEAVRLSEAQGDAAMVFADGMYADGAVI